MEPIVFRSTNRACASVSFREALLRGQAPDYGLYMPAAIPRLEPSLTRRFAGMSYPDIAFHVVRPYTAGELDDGDLFRLCADAYTFDVPIERVSGGLFVMRLDRGPTASFKDFAARLMARLMACFARREGRRLTVLVATSGDTGGAVADAFFGLADISVVVLFPEREVSGRQRRQMTTLGGNVVAASVRGKFDDCQALVKRAFNDPAFASLDLTSANSINFGRLLPQAVYYWWACSRLGPVSFSVPSGNFGDLMGGVLAREMGAPAGRFIVAVNENDEFPRFLETGVYRPVVPSRECSSNAMNVGHPSNLARLVDLYGGWMTDERNDRGEVVAKGVLREAPDMERMRRDLLSFAVSDAEADGTIRRCHADHGTLLEPHGAVAVAAAEKAGLPTTVVALETADPAKFPEKVRALLGIEPPLPPSLAGLDAKEERYETIGNSYDEFASLLKGIAR